MQNIDDAISNDIEQEVVSTELEAQTEQVEDSVVEPAEKPSLQETLTKAYEKHAAARAEADKSTVEKPVQKTEPATNKIVDPITGRESEPIKAPAGWTPLLREKWGTIDPTVQQFITDRERNMAQTMSKTSDDRKLATEFREVFSPYENTFRQMNTTAVAATKEVMSQWHMLQTGSPEAKAHLIHQIITSTKPDFATLAALASGQRAPAAVAQHQPSQVNIDEILDKKLKERAEAEFNKYGETLAQQFINDPANEYAADLEEAMLELITSGHVDSPLLPSGQVDLPTIFKKAYDLACSQHPEISQRLAAKAASVQRPVTAKPVQQVKRSLGNGAASKAPAKRMTVEQAAEAAFNKHAM